MSGEPQKNGAWIPAGFWLRALTFAWDSLPIAVYLTLLVVAGIVGERVWPTVAGGVFANPISGEATGFLVITLPVSLYFALFEASPRQATWGKQRVRLKVTDLAGRRVSHARSLGRTALKLVPWELAHACIWQISFATDRSSPVYAVGFSVVWFLVAVNVLSMLASPRRQTLYDRIAGTLVVRSGTF